jgi:hypothetical protein
MTEAARRAGYPKKHFAMRPCTLVVEVHEKNRQTRKSIPLAYCPSIRTARRIIAALEKAEGA